MKKRSLMKKYAAVIMAAVMAAAAVTGCGTAGGTETTAAPETTAVAETTTAAETTAAAETITAAETAPETTAAETVPVTTAAPTFAAQEEFGDVLEEGFAMAADAFMAAPQMMPAAKQYAGASAARANWNGLGFPGEPGAPQWNTEEYDYIEENGWRAVSSSPFSTFAADVDTASYANIRRMILRGQAVPADAVRIEEMINYFAYDYPEPADGEPFSVTTEIAPCPWNEDTELLLVGLQAKKPDMEKLPASNLVFLIDVSGSMDEWNKLPLVQRAFLLLAENLDENDRVSVVTYAAGDTVVLEGVRGSEKAKITAAVEDLMAGGGTNGSAGIKTAYELAEKFFIPGGNNRVIMATDGDLNIGVTDQGSLTRLIEDEAKSGVYLSVLGFGEGNLADARMEALADHGNGNYSYIDDIAEARRVLTQEAGGTLFTVAKDVKLQVEFNPAKVKGYRLIGYENRVMAAEDFADDTKDGGELGAGHRVTALFEIAQPGSKQEIAEPERKYGEASEGSGGQKNTEDPAAEWCTVSIRYKDPEEKSSGRDDASGQESILLEYPVDNTAVKPEMSDDLSWAAGVAQVGMILKDSEYKGSSELSAVTERLAKTAHAADDSYRREFLYLTDRLARAE